MRGTPCSETEVVPLPSSPEVHGCSFLCTHGASRLAAHSSLTRKGLPRLLPGRPETPPEGIPSVRRTIRRLQWLHGHPVAQPPGRASQEGPPGPTTQEPEDARTPAHRR